MSSLPTLKKRLSEIDAILESVPKLTEEREETLKAIALIERLEKRVQGSDSPKRQTVGENFSKLKQADAAAIIVRNAGRPMKVSEIIVEMVANGFPGELATLDNSLNGNLWKKKQEGLWIKHRDKTWEPA